MNSRVRPSIPVPFCSYRSFVSFCFFLFLPPSQQSDTVISESVPRVVSALVTFILSVLTPVTMHARRVCFRLQRNGGTSANLYCVSRWWKFVVREICNVSLRLGRTCGIFRVKKICLRDFLALERKREWRCFRRTRGKIESRAEVSAFLPPRFYILCSCEYSAAFSSFAFSLFNFHTWKILAEFRATIAVDRRLTDVTFSLSVEKFSLFANSPLDQPLVDSIRSK